MQTLSFYQEGTEVLPIHVEVHARFQIPSFQILGLPAPEIQEARERVMAAFQSSGFEFPKKKVIVNLAPSSIKKSGTGHDLAIALSILSLQKKLKMKASVLAWGELSLTGEIRPCGRIPALFELLLTLPTPPSTLVLCSEDYQAFQALYEWREEKGLTLPPSIHHFVINQLSEIDAPSTKTRIHESPSTSVCNEPPENSSLLPLSSDLQRILEISLIGRHHLLLLGPKGVGKSQALQWYHHLQPPSEPKQTWTRLLLQNSRFSSIEPAPIREVHSQVRPAHLFGSWGAQGFHAGELARSHGGILIADEFLEWPRDSKESLREVLQNKKITLSRVRGQLTYDCDIQLVATGNLCPCGGLPAQYRSQLGVSEGKLKKLSQCRCHAREVDLYSRKLSGPIADRIDLVCFYGPESLPSSSHSETSFHLKKYRSRIRAGRIFAEQYFGALPSELSVEWLESNLPHELNGIKLLQSMSSFRARHKVLRIARSIQALDQEPRLTEAHLFEAMSYRFKDT